MTKQQIYTYLVKNDVPEILAASIAKDFTPIEDFSFRYKKLSSFLDCGVYWGEAELGDFYDCVHMDINPVYRGKNFWLNPLLLPKKYRPERIA